MRPSTSLLFFRSFLYLSIIPLLFLRPRPRFPSSSLSIKSSFTSSFFSHGQTLTRQLLISYHISSILFPPSFSLFHTFFFVLFIIACFNNLSLFSSFLPSQRIRPSADPPDQDDARHWRPARRRLRPLLPVQGE